MSTNDAAYPERLAGAALTPLSRPLRNLGVTLTLTFFILALAQFAWGPSSYEKLIPVMGWPHVLLGFVFYFGRVLRGETRTRPFFLLLVLATALLWSMHYRYGIIGFISIYFVYHVLRDEVFVYQQTRARHRLRGGPVYVAGVVPLILLILLIPQPQHYRQDLRRVELAGSQFSQSGWTLVSFQPIPYSHGHEFYFFLQAPNTQPLQTFTTAATIMDSRSDGEIRVGDKYWPDASDLVFRPHYAGLQDQPGAATASSEKEIRVGLAGGHRVGQRFTAEHDNLAGIWLSTERQNNAGKDLQFIFHLASPALLPLPKWEEWLRVALIVILSALAIWQIVPKLKPQREFWLYFAILLGIFVSFQQILQNARGFEHLLPMMFQVVVIFHYISWYVFSFDKLFAFSGSGVSPAPARGAYDRVLNYLRDARSFAIVVAVLNLVSLAGSLWYYRWNGPAVLSYGFDYSYFLYVLVFHVTFSFSIKPRNRVALTETRALTT